MASRLIMKQETVLKLFEALGFKTAKTWSPERLQKKIKQLPDLVDGVKIRNPKVRKILKAILDTTAKGGKVVLKSLVEEEIETETKKEKEQEMSKKKTKKVSKKKARVETVKVKKTDVEKKVDSFGSRVGSKNATLNKCLSKKPKGMAQLVKEAKLSGTFYTHLNQLIDGKFIKKTEKGFVRIK